MAHLWTVNTGHDLGTYQESITQSIALPIVTGTTISLISGKIPGGLRIENNSLVGTPFEVKRLRTFTFVLRAIKDNIKEDVTLKLKINGADAPTWVTAEGPLPLGPNNRFYILDIRY